MRRVRSGIAVVVAAALGCAVAVIPASAQQVIPPDGQLPIETSKRPKPPKFLTSCDVPRELVRLSGTLADFSRTLAEGKPVEIVALGSSSTAGSGASSPQASYPARLQAELLRRFPGRDIEVHNYGVGGQLARDMLERIEANVLPMKPSLVIWQTGVNDAVQDVGVELFRETLNRGIKLLKAEGVDVILVDMQFYPKSERVAGYLDYLRAMRTVADTHAIGYFPRHAIMKHMVRSGQHSPEQLLAPDNFHLNDLSYGCLADLMADGIEAQLKGGRLDSANRLSDSFLQKQ